MDDLKESILAAIRGSNLDCADWSHEVQGELTRVVLNAVEASLGRVFLKGYYKSVERDYDHE